MLKQNAGFEGPPLQRGTGETEGNDHEGLRSVQRFIMVERSLREVRLDDHGNQRDDTCCDTDPRTGVRKKMADKSNPFDGAIEQQWVRR
jgi:hypothetical protein